MENVREISYIGAIALVSVLGVIRFVLKGGDRLSSANPGVPEGVLAGASLPFASFSTMLAKNWARLTYIKELTCQIVESITWDGYRT